MYSGQIQGSGPRYCPSIEDKVVRFAEKDAHQIFLEPEGRNTREYYVNGISTSLPKDVQHGMLKLIPGLENAEVMRWGYAVEYDFAPPDATSPDARNQARRRALLRRADQRHHRLRRGRRPRPHGRAQRRRLKLKGEPPLILDRSQAYIGVLIDDLVTKGVDEPYRMFTSRAEYRLLLRHDNADRRLTPLGAKVGSVSNAAAARLAAKEEAIVAIGETLRSVRSEGDLLATWLRRTNVTWAMLCDRHPALRMWDDRPDVVEQVVLESKYAGYIDRQAHDVARLQKTEGKRIPETFDYSLIPQLRVEAREKFSRIRPVTIGQASRVSGITPADLAVLLLYLE